MASACELLAISSGIIFTTWLLIMVIAKKFDSKHIKLKSDDIPFKVSSSMQPTLAPRTRKLSQSNQSFSDLGLLYNGDLEMLEQTGKSTTSTNVSYKEDITFDIPDPRKVYQCQRCNKYVNITVCTMHKHSMWVCERCYYN